MTSAIDVVRLFGAVQAQDYAGAMWALGQRTSGITEAEVGRLYDEGKILRTHVMRPTWHFVLPDDIRWLLDLTGARLRRGFTPRHRQLGLDEADVSRAVSIFGEALAGGRFLTRTELGDRLRAAGIAPEGQRLPHLLGAAEVAGAIISGPRRGKQMTYALLAERAPGAQVLERPEALAELTRRYFRAHGPAQLQDFVWWSGLTVSDARTGLALAGADLDHQTIDDKDYWLAPGVSADDPGMVAHLLPNWDEYTVGYRDRAAAHPPDGSLHPDLFAYGNILSNVVTIGGKVRGGWRRVSGAGGVRIEIRVPARLAAAEAAAVDDAAHRFGRFLEVPVETVWR